jgi:hypothetical protein
MAALLLCCVLAGGAALAAPAATTVDRWVVGGGGGHAESAGVAIDATIGQPVVREAEQAPYTVLSGFWFPVRAAAHQVYLPLVFRGY